jgi:hypothetical protein
MLRNVLLLTFGTLATMLVLAYCTTDVGQRDAPTAAEVVDLFDRLALSGFGEAGPAGQGPSLRRWSQPVRIAVIGGPAEGAAADWSRGVAAMAAVYDVLPHLDVSVVETVPFAVEGEDSEAVRKARETANLVVWTVPAEAVDDFTAAVGLPPQAAADLGAPRDGCAVAGAKAAVLSNVAIVLRDDLGQGRRRTCLGEALAMALGFHIQEKTIPDVFRTRDGGIGFHPLGRMAAALLYDEAMEPGLSRPEALARAEEVLRRKGLK